MRKWVIITDDGTYHIEAESFEYILNRLSFFKNNRLIAMFLQERLIGFYEEENNE